MSADFEATDIDKRCGESFAIARKFAIAPAAEFRPSAKHSPAQARSANLFGESSAMNAVYEMIAKVAPSEASVLLIGENGTGKELTATAIHEKSSRAGGPFVAINCGAFSPTLIEAELFGYERGAFTGATRSHRGCFERASGGTLFLDEIAEMPVELQIKLLRALETSRYYRVGGEQELEVNVRVIAATNRDPNEAVTRGILREDLLYRLGVFPLPLPPLRERGEDVGLLAQHFLDELNAAAETTKNYTPAAREFLAQHPWPGNVRELKNAVQRAFIMSESDVNFSQPTQVFPQRDKQSLPNTAMLQFVVGTALEDIEREVIIATLEHCRGRKRETAELLGVSLKTLYNRLNEYRGDAGADYATSDMRTIPFSIKAQYGSLQSR